MPLKSMTGYGRAEASDDIHVISVEIKSVNNRYLDFQCRGPRELLNLDNVLRKELGAYVTRGSVTCNVNVETRAAANETVSIALNEPLAAAYVELARRDAALLGTDEPPLRPADLLRVSGMVAQGEAAASARAALERKILAVSRAACCDLVDMRAREGGELARDFEARIRAFGPALDKVAELLPARNRDYAAKLRERVAELIGEAKVAEV